MTPAKGICAIRKEVTIFCVTQIHEKQQFFYLFNSMLYFFRVVLLMLPSSDALQLISI